MEFYHFLFLIFAGIGAAGAVTGGASAIATAANNKASNNAKLQQQREHDARVEAALKGNGLFLPDYEKGNGFSEGVKAFAEKTGLDVQGKKLLRSVLKPLSDKRKCYCKRKWINFNSKIAVKQLLKLKILQLKMRTEGELNKVMDFSCLDNLPTFSDRLDNHKNIPYPNLQIISG